LAYTLKRLLVGKAKKTAAAIHERLTKKTGLAVFASDALSSTAYASEEILLVLAVAYAFGQRNGFNYVVPITFAIAIVLVIVAISYRQTIFAYPSGGGAYIVAKENLGTTPGLVAAAALLVDYVLTVSVSISAGVAAITSAAQGTSWAWLDNHKVFLCLGLIALIALANLRGVRESGALFAGPTYSFVISFMFMIGYGIIHYFLHPGAVTQVTPENLKLAEGYSLQPLSIFLLLGAFSNGCVALTGIEAISNGIPAFKQPESRNAATTLTWMAALLTTMFIGTSIMAYLYQVHPHENETVISQFPRLASLLARDRFVPRQFATRGDKLVFSNGIIILAVFAGVLVVAFGGDTSRLIPLYAVGVFLSFTLSQTGMVRHWLKAGRALKAGEASVKDQDGVNARADNRTTKQLQIARDELKQAGHWKKSIVVNGLGAIATFIVLVVLVITKFIHGAWIVVVLIPLLVALFRAIHRHYMDVATQLTTEGLQKLQPIRHEVIVPISGIHRGVLKALEYAKAIAPHHVTAVYINVDEEATQKLRTKWSEWTEGVELVVIASPYRSLVGPLVRYVDRRTSLHPDQMVTIVLPEFIPSRWWHHLLHNQTSLLLKGALLFKPNVVVTSVPYHLKH
jgi:amino acid transporter